MHLPSQADLYPAVRSAINDLSCDLQRRLDKPDTVDYKSVHKIRVDIKHLRAWIRLLRKLVENKEEYKHYDKSLRDIARRFARQRDTRVLNKTYEWLHSRTDNSAEQSAINTIRTGLYLGSGMNTEMWPADTMTVPATDFLPSGCDPESSDRQILKEIDRRFMRIRRRKKDAFGPEATAITRHQLRKRIKYLYYQLQLMNQYMPIASKKDMKQYRRLGKWLGWLNDLNNLERSLVNMENDNTDSRPVPDVQSAINRQQERLLKKCYKTFDKVFVKSESPTARCRKQKINR